MSLRLRPFPADLAGVVSGWATTEEEVLLWCGRPAAPVSAAQISAVVLGRGELVLPEHLPAAQV